MFENLKHKNPRRETWHNMPNANNYHISPSATTGQPKGNEADRMVNCRICGFPCDKERDSKSREGSWAGLGITYGQQLTAGTSIGDKRISGATGGATTVDQYYERTVSGGCPNCGCLTYYL